MEKGIGAIFLLAGLACSFGAFLLIRRSFRRLKLWKRVDGTVVDHLSSMRSRNPMYRPIIEFLSPGGERVRFNSSVASSRKFYQTGARVKVLFDPSDSHNADLVDFSNLWMGGFVVVFLGVTFSALGAFLLCQ